MGFRTTAQVRFAHIDAAAIVFYPRYFEFLNGAVEDWFAAMGHDFHGLHVRRQLGVPTVSLQCEFQAPSELGDILDIDIEPRRIGGSSCAYDFRMSAGGQQRILGNGVLVCMDLSARKSVPWPEDMRAAMTPYLLTA
ncbi:acyl-CoA thioesterase [Rhizorhabdus sp.]|uniref:acyl-CoA thioesterase n=1 Tax=Rhizorhabdus sp. TaxID=1968843 RepID=UPI0035B25256